MAAREMYDDLSVATPDYSTTSLDLSSIRPQDIIEETPIFNQEAIMGDDGSIEVNSLDDGPLAFITTFKFNHKSDADIGTLLEFIFNTSKANGMENTFKLIHPEDGHTYVVRYWGDLSRLRGRPSYQAIPTVTFRVEGTIAD